MRRAFAIPGFVLAIVCVVWAAHAENAAPPPVREKVPRSREAGSVGLALAPAAGGAEVSIDCAEQEDGTPCDDGNPCTSGETCRSGACVSPVAFQQAPGSPVGVGSNAYFLVVADLDSDGHPDLAVANYDSANVTILLGDGSGAFTEAEGSPVGVGEFPTSLAAGDFNLDAKPDLAVTNSGSNTVTILLGQGNGAFLEATGSPVAVGSAPYHVAAGDLNLDSRPDIAVANSGSNTVSVLLGNGSGGFTETSTSPIGVGSAPLFVAVGDFDLDGRHDLALANSASNSVTVLLGDGSGAFSEAPGSPVGAGSLPDAMAVGDFDLDGRLDLALANGGSNSVTILLGDGRGGFTPAAGSPYGAIQFPDGVVVGDVDLDGKPDLVVASYYDNAVTILLGNGSGGFTEAAGSPVGAGPYPDSVAVGDFDLDGKADIAVPNGLNVVTILLNVSGAVVCPAGDSCQVGVCDPASGGCSMGHAVDGAACTDGNPCTANDGCRSGECIGATVSCTPVDQCHVAGTCEPATGCSNPDAPEGTTCNDANGCTRTDECHGGSCVGSDPVVCPAPDECRLPGVCEPATGVCTRPAAPDGIACDDGNLCATGEVCAAGSCGPPIMFGEAPGSPIAVGSYPNALDVADVNLDGKADLVTVNGGSSDLTVLLGTGAGGFSEATGSPVRVGSSPTAAASSDFNLDGKPDLAVTYYSSDVTILLGDGSGGFSPLATLPLRDGSGLARMVASDFNLDGKPDLAVTNHDSGNVAILLGDGSGTLTRAPGSGVLTGWGPYSIAVSDFDLDGDPDLAVTNRYAASVTILLGDGAGGFNEASGSPIAVEWYPEFVLSADFTGDGKPDLAVTDRYSAGVTILRGDGSGRFTRAGSPIALEEIPDSFAMGDFDLDGKLDLIAAGRWSISSATILRGDGTGGFTPAPGSPFDLIAGQTSIAVADFDRDGKPDLAVPSNQQVAVLLNASNVLACPSSDACNPGLCDPATGACGTAPAPDGSSCADGNPCTTNDACVGGTCGGAPVTCLPDQCQLAGTCDPAVGCPTAPDETSCDDGNACTQADACEDGSCVGERVVCPPPESCQIVTCDPATGCTSAPAPDGSPCDDGNLCTTESCRGGSCVSTPIVCTALDQCHHPGTCDPATGLCSNPTAPDGAGCNDDNACTQSDMCLGGLCSGSAVADGAACPGDGNPCTAESCRNGACTAVPVRDGTECDDGNSCTRPDTCQTGVCRGTLVPEGGECSDGNACTLSDTCHGGVCVGGSPVICPAPDQCHTPGTCYPATGVCSNPPADDGTPCDDGNLCTSNDRCVSGVCSAIRFLETSGSPIHHRAPNSVAAGDLDLDGNPDVVVVGDYGDIGILLGNGRGGFSPAEGSPFSAGGHARYVAISDFNLDGNPDLAVALTYEPNAVAILLGDGSGRFAQAPGSPSAVEYVVSFLTASDFNLDGNPDLAVALASNPDTVAILLGDGSGRLVRAPESPIAGYGVSFLAASDFNLDGRPDLAVAGFGGVTILLGDGSGGFAETAGSPIAGSPSFIATSDFNLDGKPDLAFSSFYPGDVTILLGDGSGGFAQPPGSPIAVRQGRAVAVSDFNLDGKPDLALTVGDGVTFLLGDGSGGFTPGGNQSVGQGYYSSTFAVADFDHDGRSDLAIVFPSDYLLRILWGRSAVVVCPGGDACVAAVCDPGTGMCAEAPAPDGTACSDGNACTTNDACRGGACGAATVTCKAIDQCHVAGTCDAVSGCSNPEAPEGTSCDDGNSCTRADSCQGGACTGDNPVVCPAPEVCRAAGTCDPATGACQYLLADDGAPCDDGDACTLNDSCRAGTCVSPVTFVPGPDPPLPVDTGPTSVVIADFDLDGDPDMAVAYTSGDVTILLGDGTGAFSEAAGSPVEVGPDPAFMVTGDFNVDGRTDLATVLLGEGEVAILLGDGTGGFAPASGPRPHAENPGAIVASDFNVDGKLDLAVSNSSSNGVTVLLGDGSGRFTEATGSPVGVGSRPGSMVVADFNLDGKPDLVVSNGGSHNVTVLLGDGAGGFDEAEGSPVRVGLSPGTLATADFNLDGTADLAVVNSISTWGWTYLTILLGNGSGGFVEGPRVDVHRERVAAADFNLDGKPDLVFGEVILVGDGMGGFVYAGSSVDSFVNFVADLNLDGRPDLAAVSGSDVRIMLGAPDRVVCPASGSCLVGICDPATGGCAAPAVPAPDGTSCSDGDLCTANDACRAGACAGAAVTCTAVDQCHVAGTCDAATGCSNPAAPDGTSCSDDNPCTQSDTCNGGSCAGTPAADGTACDDRDACTRSDSCAAGLCAGEDPVVCSASDQCHVAGACDPATGSCSNPPAPDGIACNDGSLCTTGDVCGSGACGQPLTFTSASRIPWYVTPYSAQTADFNGDGNLDLVVTGHVYVRVLLGNGSGGLVDAAGGQVTIYARGYVGSAAIADFNLDGKLDLAVTSYRPPRSEELYYTAYLQIFLGAGSGTFLEAAGSPMSERYYVSGPVVATDVDLDGKPDLVVARYRADGHSNDGTVTTLLGDGRGGFREAPGSPVMVEGGAGWVGAVASSDFNRDGRLDLALFSFASTGYPNYLLRILLGAGTAGAFVEAAGSPMTIGTYASHLMVSEFNLDGKPDLALWRNKPGTGSVELVAMLGDGSGRFAEAPDPTSRDSISPPAATADFNLDGIPDLAVNGGAILLGDGAGRFTVAPGSGFHPGYGPSCLAAGDFDRDGKPDLASCGSYFIEILMNRSGMVVCPGGDACHADLCDPATGTCTSEPAPVPDGLPCSDGLSCTVNDACHRGGCSGTPIVCTPLDQCHLAGACDEATGVCTSPNAPEGTACDDDSACTLSDACRNGSCTGPSAPDGTSCENHDLCTRGDTCRAGSCEAGDPLVCPEPDLCHAGSGACDPATGSCAYAIVPDGAACDDGKTCTAGETCVSGGCGPEGTFTNGLTNWAGGFLPILPGDFNLDGNPDIALLATYENAVYTILGDGAGGSLGWVTTPLNGPGISGVQADFNLDRTPDLAIYDGAGNATVLLGNGAGGFERAFSLPVENSPMYPGPWGLATADFNLDGKPDLAVAAQSGDEVKILLGDGAGGLAVAAGSSPNSVFGPLIVAASDLNHDRRPDLVVLNWYGDDQGYYHTEVTVLLGDGTGRFSEAAGSPFGRRNDVWPLSLAIADFNLDGNPDLVVAGSHWYGGVTLWLGDGSGGFAEAPGSPLREIEGHGASIVAADFNLDGKPDLAVTEAFSFDGDVALLLGDGAGGFSRVVAWPGIEGVYGYEPVFPVSLAVSDFNSDAKPDLAAGSSQWGSNSYFEWLTILLGNPGLAPAGTSCDDGSACTTSDTCSLGSCEPGSAPDCDDDDPCTLDSCDAEQGCVHAPDPTCNHAPDCEAAVASPGTLWPPNGAMVPIAITGISDPDGEPVSVVVTGIAQDEPVETRGGATCPDGDGVGTAAPRLRAERDGNGDGRVYTVSFTANDARGGTCSGTVTICVPHDQGERSCGDQGPSVDSTGTCAEPRGKGGRPAQRGRR